MFIFPFILPVIYACFNLVPRRSRLDQTWILRSLRGRRGKRERLRTRLVCFISSLLACFKFQIPNNCIIYLTETVLLHIVTTFHIFIKFPEERRLDYPKYRENQLARRFFLCCFFFLCIIFYINKGAFFGQGICLLKLP